MRNAKTRPKRPVTARGASPAVTLRLYRYLLSQINTPFAMRCYYATFDADPKTLKRLLPDPLNYSDSHSFAIDLLCTSYARKSTWVINGIDTKRAAILAESENESRIRVFDSRHIYHALPFIEKARKIVYDIIGPRPGGSWNRSCGFGPGATFDVKGAAVADEKLTRKISVTQLALPYLRAAMAEDYQWMSSRGIYCSGPTSLLDQEFSVVPGNRGLTVPKDAFTDRNIAAEPTGNLYLQMGLGRVLRHRLKRAGVDLDDQRRNQDLARIGSETGELATLDLSMASDSVTGSLVEALLPEDWYTCLNRVRSACTVISGEVRHNSKFSAMGNGFTFELETLIFYAIAKAIAGTDSVVSVYGDDIICPSDCADAVSEALKAVGFIINVDKSFVAGPYRESCGKHYFNGWDVTPIYQKEPFDGTKEDSYYAGWNRLYRWSRTHFGGPDSWREGDQRRFCYCSRFDAVLRTVASMRRGRTLIGPVAYQGEGCMVRPDGHYLYKDWKRGLRILLALPVTVPSPHMCYRDSLKGSERSTYGNRPRRGLTRQASSWIFL